MKSFHRILVVCSVLCFFFGVAGYTLGASMSGSIHFSDVPAGAYFDEAVGELADLGIVKGNPDGTFTPGDFIRRADVAVMMKRLRDDLLGKSLVSSSSSSRSSASSSSSSSSSSSTNAAGVIRFTIGAYTVDEDAGQVAISIVRSGGRDGVVSVDYTLEADSATSNEDYEHKSGTITFGDGDASAAMTVTITDDDDAEGNEKFKFVLSNPTGGAELTTPSTAEITIEDDEAPAPPSVENAAKTVSFAAASYSMTEEQDTLRVTVIREGDSDGTVNVDYATLEHTSGRADSGDDFETTSGTLSFASGETSKTFDVTILQDSKTEGNEWFHLELKNPTGGAAVKGAEKVEATIVDDEVLDFGSGTLRLSDTSYTDAEGKSVQITVERKGGAEGEVSVEYETQNGTAKAGDDYTETSGTLTFKEGETSKVVPVPLIDDEGNDPDEKFTIRISNPSGTTIDGADAAEILIQQ